MSAPDITCYDYIIGLYSGDCECYDPAPADYNESNSGLYISDLLEPKFIDSLLNCDQGASMWDLMEIVRNLAIRYFIADANALLMKQARLIRMPFNGGVGRATWTRNMSLPTGDYAGVRIRCADVRSGYLRINHIGLIPSANCTPNLFIYDTNGTLLYTIALTGVANKLTQTATTIELPLHDDYLDHLDYWLFYEVNGFQPKNNDVSCNCEKHRPSWGEFGDFPRHGWNRWIQVGGWTDDTLPDFNVDTLVSPSNYMHGLTLDVELGCYINEVLCKDSLDFDGNTLAQAMAIAIQKKAGALFVDKLLRTPNLNRTVMLDREGLAKDRDTWLASYDEMVTYIIDNIDLSVNDCMECRDIVDMIKGGIFA